MTATTALAPILAHQGGWDEFLLVAAPVAFFAVLLWIANHRAKAQLTENGTTDSPDVPGGDTGPGDHG